ncbi:MAG: primosomal protein N' [Desulfotomaculum sp.]|nr:primosomal protein N' [Desulfotomaculum sp.]
MNKVSSEKAIWAEIIVEVASRRVDRPFHYLVPEHLAPLPVGSRVLVPFGPRFVPGYVVRYSTPPVGVDIKPVKKVLGQGLSPDLLALASWLSQRYLCTWAESLQCVLGPGRAKTRAPRGLQVAIKNLELTKAAITTKQRLVLTTASAQPGLNQTELARVAGVSVATVATLVQKKMLSWVTKEGVAKGFAASTYSEKNSLLLTAEQQQVIQAVAKALQRADDNAFLLHGVTGSGKTETYLQIISQVLKQGKQAIVLVPEIALTPQMITAFRSRFGSQVAVLHSKLATGERYREHLRIQQDQAQVVLGARSAVFAPVTKLGIIIIDEEHEPSYKQEVNPKYHVREVALYRARVNKAVVLMGSATPALESYCRTEFNTAQGRPGPYILLNMTKRVANKPLPKVSIVDMRQEEIVGKLGIFSQRLVEQVENRLNWGQQVLLFLNRRGYATFIVCRQCGHVHKCLHCDIALTYHADGRLRCHYCNYREQAPKVCQQCQNDIIGYLGTGTQRVEAEVQHLFPTAKVLRMDGDTTRRKDAHQKILNSFKTGQADILVGTQMIAKGLDLPGVTLVGVINADTMLYMPDFRAAERTFQLLTQVAGRAGRGQHPGETLVQTYNPEHYSITLAKDHDYLSFYKQEMQFRRALKYPPFYYLSRLLISGEAEQDVEIAAKAIKLNLAQVAENIKSEIRKVIIMGPAPAALTKVQNRYRWQVVVKGRLLSDMRNVTRKAVQIWDQNHKNKSKVSLSIDIDPQVLM